jgi:hypothetical protein
VIHEIYAGHNRKAYDKTKSIITEEMISVNKKYIGDYDIENYIHIFACSNSINAIHLDDTDRRWMVPKVTTETKPDAYWISFYKWLKSGGLEIIRWWAEEFLETHAAVMSSSHAPDSSMRREVINESRSEGEMMAYNLALCALTYSSLDPQSERILSFRSWLAERGSRCHPQDPVVLATKEVWASIRSRRQLTRTETHTERESKILRTMLTAGMREPPVANGVSRKRYHITPDDAPSLVTYLVANFDIPANATWPDLKPVFQHPEAIGPM